MPRRYLINEKAYIRIQKLGFDPSSLDSERVENCDLCGAGHFTIVSTRDRYGLDTSYMLCDACGLIFQNPRPTEEAYSHFYEHIFRPLLTAYHGRDHSLEALVPKKRKYSNEVVTFLKSSDFFQAGMSVIDIGGGIGTTSLLLKQEGMDPLVIDPAISEIETAKKQGLNAEVGFMESWDPQGRTFDLALICRTADHFLSLRSSLEQTRNILKDKGYLFIDAVDFETDLITHDDYRKFLKIDHVYYLGDRTMRLFLEAVGFKVVFSSIYTGGLNYLCQKTDPKPLPISMISSAAQTRQLMRSKLVKPYRQNALQEIVASIKRRSGFRVVQLP